MASLNEVKYAALKSATGGTGTIDELECLWLEQKGFSVGSVNERWCALLNSKGFTGSITEMQIKSWQEALLDINEDWNELAYLFWNGGGVYPP